MGHQSLGRGILLDFLPNGLAQFGDRGVESIQQLQKIASSPACPRCQLECSSCFRPFSRHNRFLQRKPSLRAAACSWFMIRVRACTIRCPCHNSCRRSRFSQIGTQIRGKRSSSSKRKISRASSRSVFCLRTGLLPISLHRRSTTQGSATNGHVHWLPSQPVGRLPGLPDRGKTFPLPHDVPVVALPSLPFPYRLTQFVGTGVIIRAYHDHCSAPTSELLVWIDPPSLLGCCSRHCYGIIYTTNRRVTIKRHFRSRDLQQTRNSRQKKPL